MEDIWYGYESVPFRFNLLRFDKNKLVVRYSSEFSMRVGDC